MTLKIFTSTSRFSKIVWSKYKCTCMLPQRAVVLEHGVKWVVAHHSELRPLHRRHVYDWLHHRAGRPTSGQRTGGSGYWRGRDFVKYTCTSYCLQLDYKAEWLYLDRVHMSCRYQNYLVMLQLLNLYFCCLSGSSYWLQCVLWEREGTEGTRKSSLQNDPEHWNCTGSNRHWGRQSIALYFPCIKPRMNTCYHVRI